jgi:hypothetical protein
LVFVINGGIVRVGQPVAGGEVFIKIGLYHGGGLGAHGFIITAVETAGRAVVRGRIPTARKAKKAALQWRNFGFSGP